MSVWLLVAGSGKVVPPARHGALYLLNHVYDLYGFVKTLKVMLLTFMTADIVIRPVECISRCAVQSSGDIRDYKRNGERNGGYSGGHNGEHSSAARRLGT
jgi:hypothetical protein